MKEPQLRKAIYLFHCEGMPIAQIARTLRIDRKTVRQIIGQRGQIPDKTRKDNIEVAPDLLTQLYQECDGYVQRIHEKLSEEHGIRIGYSTLTHKIRSLQLGRPDNQRCDHVDDVPGAEMQHDTSIYKIKMGDKTFNLIGSLVYLRYSKLRYLRFYRSFDRFKMKGFLHDALMFWGYSAAICIIDNTSLARLRGTGKNAIIVPEMEQFAGQYGFEFKCHELNHANRKAGNERGFYTVETNFFPGRQFESLHDLNRQAFEWATVRSANKPMSKTGLIPARAFEFEQGYLKKLPVYLPAPYVELFRSIDQYGYIAVHANYYWIPGIKRFEVKVLMYSDQIKIYHQRNLLIEYSLAPEDVRNQKFHPPGCPKPLYQPSSRKKPTDTEEKILRSASSVANDYLNFVLSKWTGKKKHQFIRRLYRLYRNLSAGLFDQTISRALTYRIEDFQTIERIAVLQTREAGFIMPSTEIDEQFRNRQSYIEGRFSDEVDLSVYQIMDEEDHG